MANVYYRGDKVFLYTKFQSDMLVIDRHKLPKEEQNTNTDNSKINGNSAVFIDGDSNSTYVNYYDGSYYDGSYSYSSSQSSGYASTTYGGSTSIAKAGQYSVNALEADTSEETTTSTTTVISKDTGTTVIDKTGTSTDTGTDTGTSQGTGTSTGTDTSQVTGTEVKPDISMKVRILHDENGDIFEDLPWTDMEKMSDTEFFYNYIIPYTAPVGQYQIVYKSNYKENGEDVIAYNIETLHIISKSDVYEDTVKIFGVINYNHATIPVEDVRISIVNNETNEKIYQSLSNREGKWEAYLYPGMYTFSFYKVDYTQVDVVVEITDDVNELPFNNISIGQASDDIKGTGIFRIFDKYITKTGQPLNGLTVKIANTDKPNDVIAQDVTNYDGIWEAYLDDGVYLLRVSGISLSTEFNKTFRLRVDSEGEYTFEDISDNLLTNRVSKEISNGDGKRLLTDFVKDRFNNPIVDVQVNAYLPGSELSDDTIIAQDYTDANGNWCLKLNPGDYTIEFYHPNFNVITETRHVDG